MSEKKSLREQMPETSRVVDEWRAVFGRESVDAQIRAALRGAPTFWARERGVEIGTRPRLRDE